MKTSVIATTLALLAASAAAAGNETTTGSNNNNATTPTSGCWEVSVEHDATYCIEGPICSGSGLEPTGSKCPVKGDVATADCHDYLASYGSDSSCSLPVDSTCQVIKTGAWGCVLSSSGSSTGQEEGAVGSSSGSGSTSNATVSVMSAGAVASSGGGLSAVAVGVIAAGAACVAAVAGFALYKQHQKHSAEEAERARLRTYVDVVTP